MVILDTEEFMGDCLSLKELQQIRSLLGAANLISINEFFRKQLTNPRYADPRKLNHYEHQVFSQNGEDGMVAEIFKRIGIQNRFFVEFGTGDEQRATTPLIF